MGKALKRELSTSADSETSLWTMPKGRPTTSTERMQLKKLRDQGLAPPIKKCRSCGKETKPASGSSKAAKLGLCWDCWRSTPEGKKERRRQNLVRKVWIVAYFSAREGEGYQQFSRARQAIGHAYVDRTLVNNSPVVCVWSNGDVTAHFGLTSQSRSEDFTTASGQFFLEGPDEPDADWFKAQVPEPKRTWFE